MNLREFSRSMDGMIDEAWYWVQDAFIGVTAANHCRRQLWLPGVLLPLHYSTILHIYGPIDSMFTRPRLRHAIPEAGILDIIRDGFSSRAAWLRRVIQCYRQGVTSREVADVLGRSSSAVSSLLTYMYHDGEVFRPRIRREAQRVTAQGRLLPGGTINVAQAFRRFYIDVAIDDHDGLPQPGPDIPMDEAAEDESVRHEAMQQIRARNQGTVAEHQEPTPAEVHEMSDLVRRARNRARRADPQAEVQPPAGNDQRGPMGPIEQTNEVAQALDELARMRESGEVTEDQVRAIMASLAAGENPDFQSDVSASRMIPGQPSPRVPANITPSMQRQLQSLRRRRNNHQITESQYRIAVAELLENESVAQQFRDQEGPPPRPARKQARKKPPEPYFPPDTGVYRDEIFLD